MSRDHDYFVILGGMRTGSNFLERNLNTLSDVRCYGELYNPYFVAHEKMEEFLGVTMESREERPLELIERIQQDTTGLAGFRLFHGHDPRVLDHVLRDRRCAKILLTRNPLDSYISWKLARLTDQWVLTDADSRVEARAVFDPAQFREQFEDNRHFFDVIRLVLQETGQAAFEMTYEDTQSLQVLNGLATFLGSSDRIGSIERSLKKQNPAQMRDKVANFDEMRSYIEAMDPFGLDVVPSFESSRTAATQSWRASEAAPLLFQPVRSSSEQAIQTWLAELGPVIRDMTQKDYRQWARAADGAVALTVLRHPVARAWTAFAERILPTDRKGFAEVRSALVDIYGVPLPTDWPTSAFDGVAAREAFLAFLGFVKANLSGQTSLRTEAIWASQLVTVQGFCTVRPPDHLLREENATEDLARIAARLGVPAPETATDPIPMPDLLFEVYDAEVEAAARAAVPRDYLVFGFGDFRRPG